MHRMKIGELGEFGLIDLLADLIREEGLRYTKDQRGHRLLLGIGDDTAAWENVSSTVELFTTDTMVSGVHFLSDRISWEDLGWKALAVNYSDIAAMGGVPLYSIVTLGLPEETNVEDIVGMYRGMISLCRNYGGTIVGGDVVSSPVMFVTVALTGTSDGPPLTRGSAMVGDQVAVTGNLGSSGGGLRMFLEGLTFEEEIAELLREAHSRPKPRISEGLALRNKGVKAAMDISDGLVDDLSKLCRSSKVGAIINADKVPVHPGLREAFPKDWLSLALNGGEDYELVFTATRDIMAEASSKLKGQVTVIGEIVLGEEERVKVIDESGQPISVEGRGWDHFR